MMIYKSKYLDIWKAGCSDLRAWLIPKEFIVIALGLYRVGICWRALYRGIFGYGRDQKPTD